MFEYRMLRRIFGFKRDDVTGERKEPHTEELHDLYSSPTIVRVIKSRIMRCVGHVARMGMEEVCIGFWWGPIKGKRPLGRHRRRWKDNIKMDLRELGYGRIDRIKLAQDRDWWRALVNAVMNIRVP
jgi:hypothetical protein